MYDDNQNVHTVSIQDSVRNSINNITSRIDLPKFNKNKLIKLIMDDQILNCKNQLIEYVDSDYEHFLS